MQHKTITVVALMIHIFCKLLIYPSISCPDVREGMNVLKDSRLHRLRDAKLGKQHPCAYKMRLCPHVAGYFTKLRLFSTDWPVIHT